MIIFFLLNIEFCIARVKRRYCHFERYGFRVSFLRCDHHWIDHAFNNFVYRGRRNKKQDSEKLRVGYHKSNNKMAVPDMIDGLTVVADIEEENRCDL